MQFFYLDFTISLKVKNHNSKNQQEFCFYLSGAQISSKYDKNTVEKLFFMNTLKLLGILLFYLVLFQFFFCLFCFLYDSTLFFKDIDFFLTLIIKLFYVRQTMILKPSSQISPSRNIYDSQKKTAENIKARWTDTLIITLTSNIFFHTNVILRNGEFDR